MRWFASIRSALRRYLIELLEDGEVLARSGDELAGQELGAAAALAVPIPLASGGTGAADAEGARAALELGGIALRSRLLIPTACPTGGATIPDPEADIILAITASGSAALAPAATPGQLCAAVCVGLGEGAFNLECIDSVIDQSQANNAVKFTEPGQWALLMSGRVGSDMHWILIAAGGCAGASSPAAGTEI